MNYLLGIDVGTSGCKVVLYTDKFAIVESISSKYVSISSSTGGSEQDPLLWWRLISDSIRKLADSFLKNNNSSIRAIGISCANAVIPVDNTGKVLRPALMQYDSRSVELIKQVKILDEDIDFFSLTGNKPRSSMVSALLLYWLKIFEPDTYEKTYKFLSPAGYIISKLTGLFSMDYSRASTSMLYAYKAKEWSKTACESLGLDINKLPDLYESHQVVGTITPEASTLTKLPTTTPVTAGVMDSVAAGKAMGINTDDPYFIVLGSVARVGFINRTKYPGDCFLNAYYDSNNMYFSMGTVSGAGSSLEWIRRLVSIGNNAEISVDMCMLDKEAQKSVNGAHGLTYYPYMGGEWAPHWRDHVKGSFVGLQLSHGVGDIIRSMYEGIAFALRENFLAISETSFTHKPQSIKLCGGGSKSKIWPQILADVLGVEILAAVESDLEPMGAIIAFDQEAKVHLDFISFKPDPHAMKSYDRAYESFIATRERIY